MRLKINKVFTCILCAFLGVVVIQAQQESTRSDKEVIIIERTVDENGKEISKTITRKRGDEIDDADIEKYLQEGGANTIQDGFNWKNFGLDPNTFERFDQLFGGDENGNKLTLGLNMNFEEDRARVVEVVKGSGAFEMDIRPGDYIVSVNGYPISTYEDVQESLEGKAEGDRIRVVVLRDGQEIEKMVELRKNRFQSFQFAFPEEFGGRNFFFDFEEKPKLGIFIEDLKDKGVLVTDVIRHSAADLAGLKEGDVIIKIDEQVLTSFADLSTALAAKRGGDTISLEIKRKQEIKKIEVILN